MKIIDAFVSDLEAFLGVKRTPISLAEEWRKTGAETPETADLSKYLETVRLSTVFQWINVMSD
jgi:hypothetical protein